MTTVKVVPMPGPQGEPGQTGATGPEFGGAYGYFYSSDDQTNAQEVNKVAMPSIQFSKDVTVEFGTRIRMAQTGVYNIQFSIQVEKTDSGVDFIELWLMQNNQNVYESSTQVDITSNHGKAFVAWNFLVYVNDTNNYYELAWYSPDANILLKSRNNALDPERPAIPSVIVSVNKVGTI